MKKPVALFLIISFLCASIATYSYRILRRMEEQNPIVSPLPDFLSFPANNQVFTLDLWLPTVKGVKAVHIESPKLSAEAALVFDLTTNQTLYSHNPHKRLPMASLTKIMTAVIALENRNPGNSYRVTRNELVGENSMRLTEGEKLTLEELLYGLILMSGNDAAETLAANSLSGRASFVHAMNNKAKALGLMDTNFTNPSGLQGDGEQYSTAYDLFIIASYALEKFPLFVQVSSTAEHTIEYSNNHKFFYLENETNLLTSYPGVRGVKTGYTPEAGLCLVTYLDYKGHRIIGVLLGSSNRRQEMKDLLDYSLKSLGIEPPKHD